MSGGTKKQYKQFSINCTEDACLAMGNLICEVTVNLRKYKEYASEAVTLLESSTEEYIPAKLYDDINDKLLYRQREMLKFTADHQNSSFSYMNLREILENKQYLKSQLPDETKIILNELLTIRNWSFHNAQSLMVAQKEVTKKNIPNNLKEFVKVPPQLNPVIIQIIDRYEISMLASLTIHNDIRIKQFEKILNCMKNDYQELYDSLTSKPLVFTGNGFSTKVQYHEVKRTSGITDLHSDIAQISMAIQKSKYDGTDEEYNKWIFRYNEDNQQNTSHFPDTNSRKKIGRNEPCPCGSGKKYKNCCGKTE